jgi:hypothetical protein
MNLTLTRERARSNDQETQGTLQINSATFYTMEQPWNNNAIGHSCVPVGVYEVIPHFSPTKGDCWILNGPAQNVYADDPPSGGRSLILIHSANFAAQLQGCIAPGIDRGSISGVDAVLASREAMSRLQSILGRIITHRLTVCWDS